MAKILCSFTVGRQAAGGNRELVITGEANQNGKLTLFAQTLSLFTHLSSFSNSDTNYTVTSLVDTVPNYSALNFFPLNSFQASDMVSTSRILVAVVQMCYEAKDWDALNENIMLLTKRRSQLKQV